MGIHRAQISVRFSELDPYAHVNHAVYATYCEVARTEALAAVGLPIQELASAGYQFVVTELNLRFRRAAVAGDVLDIDTWLSEMGRASTRWSQRITLDGAAVVDAELKVGVCGPDGRPRRPEPWVFERLAPLAGEDGPPIGS